MRRVDSEERLLTRSPVAPDSANGRGVLQELLHHQYEAARSRMPIRGRRAFADPRDLSAAESFQKRMRRRPVYICTASIDRLNAISLQDFG